MTDDDRMIDTHLRERAGWDLLLESRLALFRAARRATDPMAVRGGDLIPEPAEVCAWSSKDGATTYSVTLYTRRDLTKEQAEIIAAAWRRPYEGT